MLVLVAAAGHLMSAVPSAHAWPDLYNNGPFITGPGAGFGGADLSAVQTQIGGNSYGYNHQLIPTNNRLADDFTVPAGQSWTVTSILFYSFQTGSGTAASTFTSLNLRIWSARPGNTGAVVLFGNTTINRLASSTYINCYRASVASPLGSTRPIFANIATIDPPLVLQPGTYWIDWQASGTLSSGPWAVPVTIPGQQGAAGANARWYDGAAATWINLDDGGNGVRQDLAFIVRGTGGGPAPCYANCDGSTIPPVLNVSDFICFQTRYAAGDTAANCDGSTIPPILNVSDFICFQTRYSAGCS